MHYDIQQVWEDSERASGDLIVELRDGDTATNFASTKGPLIGPSVVLYLISPSSISMMEWEPADAPPELRTAVKYGEAVWLDD